VRLNSTKCNYLWKKRTINNKHTMKRKVSFNQWGKSRNNRDCLPLSQKHRDGSAVAIKRLQRTDFDGTASYMS
jgi:hypothetical protein